MISNVLPDGVREVIQCHFKLHDRVGFHVGVPLRQHLYQTNEESIGAFFGDSVGAEDVEGLLRGHLTLINHV